MVFIYRILSVSGIQDGVNFEKGDFIYRPIRAKKDLKARELYEALRSRLDKTSQTWGVCILFFLE